MKTKLKAEIQKDVGFEIARLTVAALKYPDYLEPRRAALLRLLDQASMEAPWIGVTIFSACDDGSWAYFAEGPVAFQTDDPHFGGGSRVARLIDSVIAGFPLRHHANAETDIERIESQLCVWKHLIDTHLGMITPGPGPRNI